MSIKNKGPSGKRVQKVQKVQKVQRGRLTGLRPEGCGIALSGDEYKASVTGLAVCVICDTISSATYFLVSP